jgi:hypothetical protein
MSGGISVMAADILTDAGARTVPVCRPGLDVQPNNMWVKRRLAGRR